MIKSAKKTLHQLQTDCEKAFVKKIEQLCGSRAKWQVWTDFITAAAISIANSVDISGEVHDKREKEYKECIKRLDGEDNAAELFSYVVQALDNDQEQDFFSHQLLCPLRFFRRTKTVSRIPKGYNTIANTFRGVPFTQGERDSTHDET